MPARGRVDRLATGVALALTLILGAPALASDTCNVDIDGSETVDIDDVIAVILAFGTADPDADVDDSGLVEIDDVIAVVLAFGPCVEPGTFPPDWVDGGPVCSAEPDIQVHRYNDDLFILRQSMCTDFEGPFMYLIFGEDTVLMQDTGAGDIAIATTVYGIIDDWLAANGRTSIDLLVTHSHGHGDHIQGDSQFRGQPNTTVVGTSQSAVASFFGITNWPEQIVQYDLGGRVLDVIAIPGHHSASIALYDARTGLLLTGDTFYPGFLFITSFNQYVASIDRLVSFTNDKPLCWILGTHIEMTATPFVAYPYGTDYQPNERVLQLNRANLLELQQGVHDMQGNPFTEAHADFIIDPF